MDYGFDTNKNLLSECMVYIRTVGERTEQVCEHSLLVNGVAKEDIAYIRNISPFSQALRVGFLEAIKRGKKYSIFVDADMILLPGTLLSMLNSFVLFPEKVFCMVPACYTYSTGLISAGGPKIYRTSLLPQAVKLIPTEQASLRPETYTFKAMRKAGYDVVYLDSVVVGQDFGQYNKDIFSKTAGKFIKYPDARFAQRVADNKVSQPDYEVIAKALEYVMTEKPTLKLSADQFLAVYSKLGIEEKSAISNVAEFYQNFVHELNNEKNNYQLDSYTAQLMKLGEENVKLRNIVDSGIRARLWNKLRKLIVR